MTGEQPAAPETDRSGAASGAARRTAPDPSQHRRPAADPVEPVESAVPDRGTVRLALTVGGLVLALLAGFGLGRVNSGDTPAAGGGAQPATSAADHTHAPGTGPHEHPAGAPAGPGGGAEPGGLSVSTAGYTLAPTSTTLTAGRVQDFRFQVRGPDRQPVTGYAVVHEKPLHMIVARRDLSGYQHLHPTMASDGTWSVPLTLPSAGIWRAYADFTALDPSGGQLPLTLGVDLVVAGDYAPDRCRRRSGRRRSTGSPSPTRAPRRSGPASRCCSGSSPAATRSPPWSPTSARTGTWWRCARVTWATCTCTRRPSWRAGR
ncbi:hypothetical protein [Plantactinospora veratri]